MDVIIHGQNFFWQNLVMICQDISGNIRDGNDFAGKFVMPSPSEPFGLTPLEAIRSGTAVISSKTCGFLSLIPSTPTFAYHDINNFAQLIIYYLHNPNERNRLLETQKKELAQHSWSKEIAKILDTLE